MTKRERLAKMLTERLGMSVLASEIREAKGFYRTSRHSESFRWEGPYDIASWSTMTDCVRNGFEVSIGRHLNCSGARIEVTARQG